MYLYGTRSPANLGSYLRGGLGAHRRSPKRLRGLAGAVPGAAPDLTASQMTTAGGGTPDPDLSLLPIIPGSSAGDVLYNATYGNLSPNQQANLVTQEQAQLVTAGLAPDVAAAQSSTDVSSVLDTFTGSGGLDVTWTGAAPDQSGFPSAAASAAGSAIANTLTPTLSAIPTWAWWAAGAAGVLVLFGAARKAF